MVGGHEETRGGRMCGSRSACPRVTSRSWFHMLNWPQCPAVEKIPGKVSGAWLFAGPRVPVSAWCENREEGATVDKFREWFPGVTRAQVERVTSGIARKRASDLPSRLSSFCVWSGVRYGGSGSLP